MPTDRFQRQFAVGDIVYVPIVVTSIGGTTAAPTVAGTTKYVGFAGTASSVSAVDAIQVVKDEL